MALESPILTGNERLKAVAEGGTPLSELPRQVDDPDAVRRIQKALRALRFPMTKSFPLPPAPQEPDGRYGDETFQAVLAFQKRVFPQDSSQWDGRVGKLTLEEMDKALPPGGGGGVVTKTFVDVVVQFVGGAATGENRDSGVTTDMNLANYNRRLRSLISIGRGTTVIRGEAINLIAEVMGKIRVVMTLPGIERGIICVFGSSAGGRNAIELAVQLNRENLPLSYVGAEDAAFFPNETNTIPNTFFDRPTNIPTFQVVPSIRAEKKISFFQTWGNHVEISSIHGRL